MGLLDVRLKLAPPTHKEPPVRLLSQIKVGTFSVFNFRLMCMTHKPSLFTEMCMTHKPSLFTEMFMTQKSSLFTEMSLNVSATLDVDIYESQSCKNNNNIKIFM